MLTEIDYLFEDKNVLEFQLLSINQRIMLLQHNCSHINKIVIEDYNIMTGQHYDNKCIDCRKEW